MALDEVTGLKPIAIYLVESHPLEMTEGSPLFRWLGDPEDVQEDLEDLIGAHDPSHVSVIVDKEPAGDAWKTLLEALLAGEVHTVVTHLAPLTSAQRQQLIGVCAQAGAQLITPGDAGRNRQRS